MHNLAANAVRHAGRGRVLLAVRRHATTCTIQVWDEGPGIAEEDRERIFDELPCRSATRSAIARRGLGLRAAHRPTHRRGGRLAARDAIDPGARLHVLGDASPLAAGEPPAGEARSRTEEGRRLTVLVVEDGDGSVREAEARWLESARLRGGERGDGGRSALRTLERMTREGGPRTCS